MILLSTHRYSILIPESKDTQNEQFQFQSLSISKSKYEDDWVSLLHTHPFTEIFYVIDGEGSFITNHHQFSVQKKDVIIINANVEHTEISSDDNPLEYIAIGIQDVSFISTTHAETDHPFIFYNFQDKQKEVLFYLNAIIQEAESSQHNFEYICQHLLKVLIIKLLRQSKLQLEIKSHSILGTDVLIAKQYIENNFRENITLDLLAEITYLNKFYLSRTFKNEVGRTPIDYLNLQRIKEAKMLLKTTNFSVSQVANIVGFSSQSYFSEVFNKYELQTPTKYRKNNLSN